MTKTITINLLCNIGDTIYLIEDNKIYDEVISNIVLTIENNSDISIVYETTYNDLGAKEFNKYWFTDKDLAIKELKKINANTTN